jgi:hypothetical protein
MTTREILLTRIAAYCAAHQMSERQFGIHAVRDHKFVRRLRNGQATLTTIERAEGFMADGQPTPPALVEERAA